MTKKHLIFPMLLVVLASVGYFSWSYFRVDSVFERQCRANIIDSLRAPATASVAESRRDGQFIDGSRRMRLAIDAENAYGANIRNFFVCIRPMAAETLGSDQVTFKTVERDEWLSMGKSLTADEVLQACQSSILTAFTVLGPALPKVASRKTTMDASDVMVIDRLTFEGLDGYFVCEVSPDLTSKATRIYQ